MRSSIPTLIALAASVSAIQITFPNITNTNGMPSIDLSVAQTITWLSDSPQDPKTIKTIALVVPPATQADMATNTPVSSLTIASGIDTSALKYVMEPPAGLTVNTTYQIWFYGDYNSTLSGVVAESSFFKAAKVADKSASTTTAGSPGSAPTGSTTTQSPSPSTSKKPNGAGRVGGFAAAGLLTACAMLFL